jgi:hypothetical protein
LNFISLAIGDLIWLLFRSVIGQRYTLHLFMPRFATLEIPALGNTNAGSHRFYICAVVVFEREDFWLRRDALTRLLDFCDGRRDWDSTRCPFATLALLISHELMFTNRCARAQVRLAKLQLKVESRKDASVEVEVCRWGAIDFRAFRVHGLAPRFASPISGTNGVSRIATSSILKSKQAT